MDAKPASLPPRCHAISYFENDEELSREIGAFVADGLANGQPALVVTNELHRIGIARELEARAVDVTAAVSAGDLLLLDAERTLAVLMQDGQPDSTLYHHHVGEAVRQLLRGRPGPLRIFGDMVDLLWQRGRYDAAIRLEVLSNELAAVHPISVICGYSMGHFLKTASNRELVQALHGRVHRPRRERAT